MFVCIQGISNFLMGNRMTGNGAISKDFAYPALNYILDRGRYPRKGERYKGDHHGA